MLKMRRGLLTVAVSVMGLVAGNALAQTTVAGVKYEPEISLGGQKLQLNGAGVRYRAVFKVYAAALYTPAKITKTMTLSKPARQAVCIWWRYMPWVETSLANSLRALCRPMLLKKRSVNPLTL